MSFERMLDKESPPTDDDLVADHLGEVAAEAWDDITTFLEENYNFAPQAVFRGKKYGWAIRYRRSGKTLCTLYPEEGAFTVLVVLGEKETERALAASSSFTLNMAAIISGAEQYHDGRWLWLRVLEKCETADIKRLLRIKKRPRKKK